MELEDFVSKLDGVVQRPSGVAALCPAHDDHVASLSVNPGKNGGIVLLCQAGCDTANVVAAMGLSLSDLMGLPHITDVYLYTDDDNHTLYRVERWANPKTFRCVPGLPPPAGRVLYRSDALAWARERGAVVYVCEGEKDADRLGELGLVATTNVTGAGAWLPHYAAQLEGCPVVIVEDNDVPGRKHAREVASAVQFAAASVVTVVPRWGKDVSELLDLGWGLDALDPLADDEDLGMVLADNVVTRPVEWAWPGYVPFGKVTIVEGDPGDGKSIFTTDLAARWTSGAPMPDGARHDGPWPVVMVTGEDDLGDTIVPRLRAAGADTKLIRLLDHGGEPGRPFNITTDMSRLMRQVIATGSRIVTLDPLMVFLDDRTDSHNDASVRRALYPLFELARDTNAAVVLVRHLNKGSGGKAVYRGGGSIGITGAARCVYAVGRDPEQPDRRVLANTKMNIAAQPSSLAYTIEHGIAGPYLEWHGVIEANAQDILDGAMHPETMEMIAFLNTVVTGDEPLPWKDIVKLGRDEGFTEKQLRDRRGRSRLTKIAGTEGRRSVRWGYLDHEVAICPGEVHVPPSTPIGPCPDTPEDGQSGQDEAASPSAGAPGQGDMEVSGGTWESDGHMGDEAHRIEELESRPLVCDVCGATENCHRYESPWWAIRCVNHNPFSFKAAS